MNPIRSLAAHGWLTPLADFGRTVPNYYRIAFLGTALRSGVLASLPATPAELTQKLGYDTTMLEGLEAWLDLGVTIGELRRDGSRYSVRSRRAKALLKEANDPIAAFHEEYADLHHRLITETPTRLKTGELLQIADADPAIIARSSRTGEPWITDAVEAVVPETGPFRLIEMGCGSGIHIKTAAERNPKLTALGVELQEPAAEQARDNIAAWGLADRVTVESGDIRDVEGRADADLITSHQNIYYFVESDQVALLAHLLTFLKPGGRLLLTTVVRGSDLATAGLDLWGAMTQGASRLPHTDELVTRLEQAGFVDVQVKKWADGMFRAFNASRPATSRQRASTQED